MRLFLITLILLCLMACFIETLYASEASRRLMADNGISVYPIAADNMTKARDGNPPCTAQFKREEETWCDSFCHRERK